MIKNMQRWESLEVRSSSKWVSSRPLACVAPPLNLGTCVIITFDLEKDFIRFGKRFDKIWKTIWYDLKGFGKRWDLKLKPGAPLACCCCFWMLVKTVASAPSLELFSTVYFHMHVFPNCWLCGKLGWAGFKKSPQRFSLRTCLHCKFSYVFPNCWRTELRRV